MGAIAGPSPSSWQPYRFKRAPANRKVLSGTMPYSGHVLRGCNSEWTSTDRRVDSQTGEKSDGGTALREGYSGKGTSHRAAHECTPPAMVQGYGQAGQASSHPAANEGTPQSIARHKDPFAARMNLPEAGGGSNQGSHHLITDHFPEGTAVEVFSKSAQEWVLGRVLKVVPPDSVQVEWTIHGCEYIKKLSMQSEDIRLRGHTQQPLVHASSAITTALAKAEKLKRSILADESRADDHFEVIVAELVFRRDMKNRREMRMKRQAHGTGATSLTDASKAASRELYATQASPAK